MRSHITNVASINNSTVIINNYFIGAKNTKSRKKVYRKNKGDGFKLTDEKIAKRYNNYLQEYDALGLDKLSQKDFHAVYKLTWLFARLIAHYNPLYFKPGRDFNISCALHESENGPYLLFDLSGNKDAKYKTNMNKFVNKMERDQDNPLVKAFYQCLKESHFSAALVNRVGDHHRESLYKGPKYCSEKSLFIEIGKQQQQANKAIKVGIINFYCVLQGCKDGLIISRLHPHPSCRDCRKSSEIDGLYKPERLANRKLSKPRVRTLATNPSKNENNEASNLPSDDLVPDNPPLPDAPQPSQTMFTEAVQGLVKVVPKFSSYFSVFSGQVPKKPQGEASKPKAVPETPQKATEKADVGGLGQTLSTLTAAFKRQVVLCS